MEAESPNNRTPHRYEEIANDLRDAISRGDYSEGDQLPGENVIMRQYGVARATARDALAVVRHEGLAVARPGAGRVDGVIARMDAIGQRIDHVLERVTARAARPYEIERLNLPQRGAYVLVIERTHYAGERAVETCDITFPGDRYELTYTIP